MIKKHKISTLIVCIGMFFLPLIFVHIIFKWNSEIDWLSAEWSAGEVLQYIAGFETFIGTVVLGLVTVYQNTKLSKENNYLQKISVQRSLPLVQVTSTTVERSHGIEKSYSKEKASTVEVEEIVTPQKRAIHLRTYLPLLDNQTDHYLKTVKITISNIADSAIGQIRVDRIEFSKFKYNDDVVDAVCCLGKKGINYMSRILLPGDSFEITIDIFFNNILYKEFWEYSQGISVGNFDMCLYFTNTSLSGIEYKEKIYISKMAELEERVMYKACEKDSNLD